MSLALQLQGCGGDHGWCISKAGKLMHQDPLEPALTSSAIPRSVRCRVSKAMQVTTSHWSEPRPAEQELKELIASYQTLREGSRAPAICATIAETARQCNLDRDVQLPEESTLDSLTLDDRDTVVGRVYSK